MRLSKEINFFIKRKEALRSKVAREIRGVRNSNWEELRKYKDTIETLKSMNTECLECEGTGIAQEMVGYELPVSREGFTSSGGAVHKDIECPACKGTGNICLIKGVNGGL